MNKKDMMGFVVHVCVACNCEKLLNIYLTCSHTHCNLSASYTAASYIPAITSNATHGGFINLQDFAIQSTVHAKCPHCTIQNRPSLFSEWQVASLKINIIIR